ncbi:2-oxoglutarate dehydrogenase complex dihydrolipoyllysine-residue succinyltransferase [Paenibacillus mesophilus]|uniref:2-oxoglutarate dehydrogenase complex dihydrolipoyllysine-residue succinyltransferase n=1 Tax=Paenibacillus mesophilus TaxID=2582849 RepID=UPI00110D9BE6|nr:2-oxoglutarate dehydrogenase complex dihydrolipoyllysine-residue succinyltransferase [Paenibacillus mesophilus]TMV46933.1 2-oxoglutarate dehydrogenase complex dihydrolipoyllysine-residue succinyltransferase [Paenibacillus mesophilus]
MSDIKIPEMGESITEGAIAKWLVKVGDTVNQGDMLLELETDKVNLEVNAERSGVIAEIRKSEGDVVQVGEVVGTISEGAAAPSAGQTAPAAAAGAQLAEDAVLLRTAPATPPTPPAPTPAPAAEPETTAAVIASPSVRKLARERGIDLTSVVPADPNGRIHRNEVTAPAPRSAEPQAAVPAVKAAEPNPARSSGGTVLDDPAKPIEVIRMSRRRQTIATRLVEAQRTAAMLTTFNEVDMTKILDIRKRRKQSFQEKNDVGLGFMSFFTKAVVGALKKFPLLNAEIDGDRILAKKYFDIGIAVSAKEGLVVPVVRDADRLGFAEIERTIADLANKARSNTLQLSDLQGGTFSITNGGVFGSLLSTPILNTPQVGILGMHKIQWRPIALDETRMENRPMMYIALSYDHRIVDGSEAVRFLVTVKVLLEDPESLLLEG